MDVPDALRAKVNQPPRVPLEQVRSFLGSYVADAESFDELRADLQRMAEINIKTVQSKLQAVEMLLADPPLEGELARLVGWDANWVLDDLSEVSAIAWLQSIADIIREVLREATSEH